MAHALSSVVAEAGDNRWSDFGLRAGSALILGPIALFCIWHGGIAWALFLVAASVGLALEWARLAALPLRAFGTWLLVFGLIYPIALAHLGMAYSFLLLAVTAIAAGLRYGWFVAAGLPYAGIGALALLWLRLQPHHGLADTLFLVTVVWGTDIGAYMVGRLVGGRKMAPKISPGKTWSGSIGGLCAGALAGALLAGRAHGLNEAALPAGLLLSFFAQCGDLLESAIKRKLGVKDSGRTIPGHGGLFDRLDGFLVAAPVAALLAICIQGGLPLWG